MKNLNLSTLLGVFTLIIHTSCYFIDYDNQKAWPRACNTGKFQSPIEFPENYPYKHAEGNVHIMAIEYHLIRNRSLSFINQHEIGINLPEADYKGMKIEIDEVKLRYNLVDIHFHVGAEHVIKGIRGDMEMHLVHVLDEDYITRNNHRSKNYPHNFNPQRNKIFVISVPFKIDTDTTYADMNNTEINRLHIGDFSPISDFDLKKFVTKDDGYYFYKGSLTVPPCYEPVNWMVYDTFHRISRSQISDFISILTANGYSKGNVRKLQDINDRDIYYHRRCHNRTREHERTREGHTLQAQ